MNVFIVFLYLLILCGNIFLFLKRQINKVVVIISFSLLFVLICLNENLMSIYDLTNYKFIYEKYNALQNDNFGSYYLFYFCMSLGQSIDISFYTWWAIMSAMSLIVILVTLKIHKINPHVFLMFFMLYYVFPFFTGLKFYYGFCFFLLGVGFLIRGGWKNKAMFTLYTCLAGGFHVMYYIFLVFLFINTKIRLNIKNNFVKAICVFSVLLSIFLKVNNQVSNFLSNIFRFLENERIDYWMSMSTNFGFIIPVGLQLLSIYYAWNYMKISENDSTISQHSKILFYVNLLGILFYPLFMVSTTFGRLSTALSFVTLCMSGIRLWSLSKEKCFKLILPGILLLFGYYYRQFIIGYTWDIVIVPFFSVFL